MDTEDSEGANEPKVADVNGIPWEIYKNTPGIYPIGSDSDSAMLETRETQYEGWGSLFWPSGPLVDHGAWQEDTAKMAFFKIAPICEDEGDPFLKLIDAEFMYELDKRLRVCRAILSRHFPLRWAVDGEPVWTIENPPDGHPFDALGAVANLNLPQPNPQFFALKVLRHWRRFERIANAGGSAAQASVTRELVLFGETWAEARTIIRLGPAIATGTPVRKGGKLGGEVRSKKFAPDTDNRISEMRRLIKKGHTLSSAADALARRGIGKTKSANLKLWQRHADKS